MAQLFRKEHPLDPVDVDPLERAIALLTDARRLLVLTGAGVSTESGIPDFRSPGGVWTRFDPNEFQFDRFVNDPAGFWRLRTKLMDAFNLDAAKPNAAHASLAHASHGARLLGHVTQNIDGLFDAAGHLPEKLVEIHGSARTVLCLGCGAFFGYEVARIAVDGGHIPPPCPACGAPLKPGTILFGEALPEAPLARASDWARHADAFLVVGSSLNVYPVAALPGIALDRGAPLIIINEGPTSYDGHADVIIRTKAAATVTRLLEGSGLLDAT